MLKLPLVFLGLLGSALAILLPVAAQAQSFEPFPSEECSGLIVNYICHARVDGDPALYSIPTGFDGRLGLGAVRLGTNSNMFFVLDLQTEQIVAYIYTDDRAVLIPTPSGMPSYNNPDLLGQVTEEMAELLVLLVSYQ